MNDYKEGRVIALYPRWVAPMRAKVEEAVAGTKAPEFTDWSKEAIAAELSYFVNKDAIPNWIRKRNPLVDYHVTNILEACIVEGCDLYQTSYILATARHESVLGLYMTELGKNVGDKYEGRKSLGNTVKGDGPKFIGRGFVQLTGRRNYTYWMKRLKLPLLSEPDLVSTSEIAAEILVKGMMEGTFTGVGLPRYVAHNVLRYDQARRVVNGMDKAEEIAGYARFYQKYLHRYFSGSDPRRPREL